MKYLILLITLVCFSVPAFAQTTLQGATVHTGNDAAKIQNVSFDKTGKITAVGTQKSGTVIDVTGKVVTVGLIDPQSYLGLVEIWAVKTTLDYKAGKLGLSKDYIQAAFKAADGFNPNGVAIPVAREGGVTTVVLTTDGGLISGQSAWANLDSDVENFNAAIVADSVSLNAAFGSAASRTVDGSRGAATLRLKEVFEDALFYQRNKKSFDEKRTEDNAASRLDLDAISKVLGSNKPIVFSVDRAQDILNLIALSKEYKFKPIVSGGKEAWMVAKQLAEAKVPVIVDPLGNIPYSFDTLGAREDNAALLNAAGVTVLISTFDGHNVRNLRFFAGNAVRAGLPFDAALKSITKNVAEAFGMSDYGTVEKGKIANLVVWSGDPFQPSSQVEKMFINGKEVDLNNRQKELFKRYRTLKRREAPADRTPETKTEE